MPVHLLGSLDTSGTEVGYVRDLLNELRVAICVVGTRCLAKPLLAAEIPRESVFDPVRRPREVARRICFRGQAVAQAAIEAANLVEKATVQGEVDTTLQ